MRRGGGRRLEDGVVVDGIVTESRNREVFKRNGPWCKGYTGVSS